MCTVPLVLFYSLKLLCLSDFHVHVCLHAQVFDDEYRVTEFMLMSGDINANDRDEFGNTCLHWVCECVASSRWGANMISIHRV